MLTWKKIDVEYEGQPGTASIYAMNFGEGVLVETCKGVAFIPGARLVFETRHDGTQVWKIEG